MVKDIGHGLQVDTAGLGGGEKMMFCPGPCTCGHIKDGVAMDVGRGGFVISFADFEQTYLAAKAARKTDET